MAILSTSTLTVPQHAGMVILRGRSTEYPEVIEPQRGELTVFPGDLVVTASDKRYPEVDEIPCPIDAWIGCGEMTTVGDYSYGDVSVNISAAAEFDDDVVFDDLDL